MYKVIDGTKGITYLTIRDVKSHQYGNVIKIDLENASQDELKLIYNEKNGDTLVKEVKEKTKE